MPLRPRIPGTTSDATSGVVPLSDPSAAAAIGLVPEVGIDLTAGERIAREVPFWLRLEPPALLTRHRWIRLRYSSSFFDEPVRPLIRFTASDGRTVVHPMNGPVLGTAEWIGRVPDLTTSVLISPGRRLGPFGFRVDDIAPLSRLTLLRRGFASDPPWAFWSLRSRLIGSHEEAWQALKYANGGTDLGQYHEWHARLRRPLDLGGLDKPRADWTKTPAFHLLLPLRAGNAKDLEATLASLRAQCYQRWSVHAFTTADTADDVRSAYEEQRRRDRRLREPVSLGESWPDFHMAPDDRLAIVDVGDSVRDYGLAAIAETLALRPDLSIIYSDEDESDGDERGRAPILKPDWSPVFNAAVPYLGRLTCIRWGELDAAGISPDALVHTEEAALSRILGRLDGRQIGHVRRILYRRARGRAMRTAVPARASSGPTTSPEPQWPEASIIIPTRDRPELLAECVRGLLEGTDYPSFEVVIVDNGSTDRKARAILETLRGNARFTVLDRPEPFNYAKLCNDGTRANTAPMLVFMNNDIRVLDSNWLKEMVGWAVQPHIGVVGAKLLYPNGRIQHAGVVLGLGGIAGHLYRRCPGDDAGYLRQLEVAREVSAVTGACIAVERAKFDAVGGFDASNLPVDLNDIDLCLRITERGWTNICTPEARLVHLQSASRGNERDPFRMYRQERGYFSQRWVEAIRDDPCFHPGLSLFSQPLALS